MIEQWNLVLHLKIFKFQCSFCRVEISPTSDSNIPEKLNSTKTKPLNPYEIRGSVKLKSLFKKMGLAVEFTFSLQRNNKGHKNKKV